MKKGPARIFALKMGAVLVALLAFSILEIFFPKRIPESHPLRQGGPVLTNLPGSIAGSWGRCGFPRSSCRAGVVRIMVDANTEATWLAVMAIPVEQGLLDGWRSVRIFLEAQSQFSITRRLPRARARRGGGEVSNLLDAGRSTGMKCLTHGSIVALAVASPS